MLALLASGLLCLSAVSASPARLAAMNRVAAAQVRPKMISNRCLAATERVFGLVTLGNVPAHVMSQLLRDCWYTGQPAWQLHEPILLLFLVFCLNW